MKLLINLFFLKNQNGMFHYCLDYTRPIKHKVIFICRKEQRDWLEQSLGKVEIISLKKAVFKYFKDSRYTSIYTPTPHPLPFIKNQIVTIHDDYPFQNRLIGVLKKNLFQFSLIMSGASIAFVNRSNAEKFLNKLNIKKNEKFYAPNFFPEINIKKNKKIGKNLYVGLIGTDSDKKNYERIFKQVSMADNLHFYVYGLPTKYLEYLKNSYPKINLTLVDSRMSNLSTFMKLIDVVVSIAKEEGFGRPIAYGISIGKPTLLIKSEAFREFYEDIADIYDDEDSIVNAIKNRRFKSTNSLPQSDRNKDFLKFKMYLKNICEK